MYDESLDKNNFNKVSKAAHEAFCRAFGKPVSTPVEENGRIITTAMIGFTVLDPNFQREHGQYINGWGFDPYAQFTYEDFRGNWQALHGLPYKPFLIMETGVDGPADHWPAQNGNRGCRNDCKDWGCFSCDSFAPHWKAFVETLRTDKLGAQFIFEWTDENWKGYGGRNNPCKEVHGGKRYEFSEANHGIFREMDGPPGSPLIPKTIGNNETFESVLKAVWTAEAPGVGGYRGWLRAAHSSAMISTQISV